MVSTPAILTWTTYGTRLPGDPALNVRTNHVHIAIAAELSPEVIVTHLKSRPTRSLRTVEWMSRRQRLWTRHGSTRYLFHGRDLERALNYVDHWQ